MALSNNIKRLEYGGWVFKGDNTTLTMLDMKTQVNASLRDIGRAFNQSYEMIRLRFNDLRETMPDVWAEAESKKQFYQNFIDLWHDVNLEPADICAKLFLSMGQYRKLEHKLISRDERKYRISVPRRQNNLSHSVFGYQFNPGEEFAPFIKKLFKKYLTESEYESMVAYYLNGEDVTAESRFDRYKYSKKLKVDFNYKDLLERNVLCPRNEEM